MPKNIKDNSGSLSPAGKILGHIALAIIISLLLWIGRTAQLNDRILHVLKAKVEQFHMRYYLDKKDSEKRLERLEGKFEKLSYEKSNNGR